MALQEEGTLNRFPHLQIAPQYSWMQYFLSVLKNPFSVSGDSGAWVVDYGTSKWVGMVVGGTPVCSLSIIAEGSALYAAMIGSLTINKKSGRADPAPFMGINFFYAQ